MYCFANVGTIYAAAPKCASTAIANLFHVPNVDTIGAPLAAQLKAHGWEIVGVIRDPIDRFESAYNFFAHTNPGTYEPFGSPQDIYQFADAVLDGLGDPHWMPQSDYLTHEGAFLPTRCIPLESLDMPVENTSNRVESLGGYREADLMGFYASDLRLREWR
jgi:hypothetical protein